MPFFESEIENYINSCTKETLIHIILHLHRKESLEGIVKSLDGKQIDYYRDRLENFFNEHIKPHL